MEFLNKYICEQGVVNLIKFYADMNMHEIFKIICDLELKIYNQITICVLMDNLLLIKKYTCYYEQYTLVSKMELKNVKNLKKIFKNYMKLSECEFTKKYLNDAEQEDVYIEFSDEYTITENNNIIAYDIYVTINNEDLSFLNAVNNIKIKTKLNIKINYVVNEWKKNIIDIHMYKYL
jgi:GTPase Era involved in 16S rRNA processing